MKKKLIVLLGLAVSLVVVLLIFVSCQNSTTSKSSDASSTVAEVSDSSTVAEASDTSTVVAEASESSCSDCHNASTLIVSKEVQYLNSLHGSGSTVQRNTAACAICHTSEGFTERIDAGTFEIAEDIKNASPINCRTCHNIHETYTSADWSLANIDPVTLELTGDVYDKGNSNLCANCHQPRTDYAVPLAGGGDIEITSPRYGPHHGPQSSLLLGVGGYGDEYTGSNVHYDAVDNGCISCHMTDTAFGKTAGGHSLNITFDNEGVKGEFLNGCIKCHEDIESLDRNGVQTEVDSMVEELRVLLVKQGLIDGASGAGIPGTGIPGTFTSEQAGALWNYKTITEDRSHGVHNPGYTKFLLQTAIDTLK